MQLSQAFFQSEAGIHCGEEFWGNRQRERFVRTVESLQPRHASLTNLALFVVQDTIRRGSGARIATSCGDLGK